MLNFDCERATGYGVATTGAATILRTLLRVPNNVIVIAFNTLISDIGNGSFQLILFFTAAM